MQPKLDLRAKLGDIGIILSYLGWVFILLASHLFHRYAYHHLDEANALAFIPSVLITLVFVPGLAGIIIGIAALVLRKGKADIVKGIITIAAGLLNLIFGFILLCFVCLGLSL